MIIPFFLFIKLCFVNFVGMTIYSFVIFVQNIFILIVDVGKCIIILYAKSIKCGIINKRVVCNSK